MLSYLTTNVKCQKRLLGSYQGASGLRAGARIGDGEGGAEAAPNVPVSSGAVAS
jgi:hypothetical protein